MRKPRSLAGLALDAAYVLLRQRARGKQKKDALLAERNVEASHLRGGPAAGSVLGGRQGEEHLNRRYGNDGERDVVDEASWESFPASDPPAW